MKVTVVNIKELFKYLVVIVIVCIILAITTNFFTLNPYKKNNNSYNENNKDKLNNDSNNDNSNEKEINNKVKVGIEKMIDKGINYINTNVNKRSLLYFIPDIKLEHNNENSDYEDKKIQDKIVEKVKGNQMTSKILGMQLSVLNDDNLKRANNCNNLICLSENINYDNKNNNNDNDKVENEENDIIDKNIAVDNNNQETSNEDKKQNNINGNKDLNNLSTKVIEEKNIAEKYTNDINGIKIKNQSSYEITNDLLDVSNVKFDYPKNILIFHTHTCESYTQTDNNRYTESGNFRTLDLNNSVARVGTELENELKNNYGYSVIHNTTYHDYPKYNGSYSNSCLTVSNILKDNPNYNFVIDLHRDAVGSDSAYAPRVQIGNEKVAQIMFVLGTDGGGLYHPNWRINLKYAVAIQKKANELYPGLFRPIILRNSRYNQQLSKGAVIIEVGATGNTLDECIGSMKYLAKVISETIK